MTQATSRIEFDQEIYKTRSMEGPFPSLTALKKACVPMTPEHPSWEAYAKWSSDLGVNPAKGSIIASPYSPLHRQRRFEELQKQVAGITTFKVPDILKDAFTQIAAEDRDTPIHALLLTTTRWTLALPLRKEFPELDIHFICQSPKSEDAYISNKLVHAKMPNTAYAVRFLSEPRAQFDIVSSDFESMYMNESRSNLDNHIGRLASTGADHIVISNVFSNLSKNGKAQWYAQRAFGGVIPLRIPARGELTEIMEDVGFIPTTSTQSAMNIPLDPNSAFNMKSPQMDHFHFVRKSSFSPA